MRNDLVELRTLEGNDHVWRKDGLAIGFVERSVPFAQCRSEMLTEVHIAPLTELSWIGNNEVYKYLVPNGTKANVFAALPLDVRKVSAFP
jgi:hypothetical protein